MANILEIVSSDGRTPLPVQYINGIPQPLVRVDMTYGEEGGEGMSEYVIRNISSNFRAERVQIRSPQPPTDPDSGDTLISEWAYQDVSTRRWFSYSESLNIPVIEPGVSVRLRVRMVASAEASVATYRGSVIVDYIRASI